MCVCVSDYDSAVNLAALRHLGITHIMTLVPDEDPRYIGEFEYMIVDVHDSLEEDLLQYFPRCNEFIADGMQKGKVLVHCECGISRASTIVIAFLMQPVWIC